MSVSVSKGRLGHHLGDIDATAEASAHGRISARGSRNTLEGVFASCVAGGLVKGCAGLVVWQVRLSRVGKQRQYSGDSLSRASLTRGDHCQVPLVKGEKRAGGRGRGRA
jgi:hypothetical protein